MLKGNKLQNFNYQYEWFQRIFCRLLNPNDVFCESVDGIKHFLFNYSDKGVGQIFGIMDADIFMEEMEKAISQLKSYQTNYSFKGTLQWPYVYVKYLILFSKAVYLPNPGLKDYLFHFLKRWTLISRIITGVSLYWASLINCLRELRITDW